MTKLQGIAEMLGVPWKDIDHLPLMVAVGSHLSRHGDETVVEDRIHFYHQIENELLKQEQIQGEALHEVFGDIREPIDMMMQLFREIALDLQDPVKHKETLIKVGVVLLATLQMVQEQLTEIPLNPSIIIPTTKWPKT